MAFEIKKAEQVTKPLKIAYQGPAGSGKTDGAIATAIRMGFKNVVVIDTEHRSSANFSKKYNGAYSILGFEAPYTSARYVEALNAARAYGADCVIVDSITHQWDGQDGILDRKDKEQRANPSLNSYTLWSKYTAEHKKFIEFLLAFPIPIFVTMRSKTAYVLTENDRGRQVPKKMGMEPIQRDGVDYEFDIVAEINIAHTAEITKDRTGVLADKQFDLVGSDEFVKILQEWQKSGAPLVPAPTVATPTPAAAIAEPQPPPPAKAAPAKAAAPKATKKKDEPAPPPPPPAQEPMIPEEPEGDESEGTDPEPPAQAQTKAAPTTSNWTPEGWAKMEGKDKLGTVCKLYEDFFQEEELDDLDTAIAKTKVIRDDMVSLLRDKFVEGASPDRKKEQIAEEMLKSYRKLANK